MHVGLPHTCEHTGCKEDGTDCRESSPHQKDVKATRKLREWDTGDLSWGPRRPPERIHMTVVLRRKKDATDSCHQWSSLHSMAE